MPRTMPFWIAVTVIFALAAACAGSAVPTSSPDVISTIVAATMAARSPTPGAAATATDAAQPAATATQASIPPTLQPVIPTAAQPPSTRITFLPGATTGVVSGHVQPGQVQTYVLQASLAQRMLVNLDSQNQDVMLSLRTQGGTNMLSASANQTTWQGSLPQTEDYYLGVHAGAADENFTLTVTIPARIKFQEGTTSAKLSGSTAGGYAVSYAAYAVKGQNMSVNLTNLSNNAALTIYGFTDGQPYVRSASEQTSFSFTLPKTQDYIIEVVPQAGAVVNYVLGIKIE